MSIVVIERDREFVKKEIKGTRAVDAAGNGTRVARRCSLSRGKDVVNTVHDENVVSSLKDGRRREAILGESLEQKGEKEEPKVAGTSPFSLDGATLDGTAPLDDGTTPLEDGHGTAGSTMDGDATMAKRVRTQCEDLEENALQPEVASDASVRLGVVLKGASLLDQDHHMVSPRALVDCPPSFSLRSTKSWIKRVQSRAETLRRQFGLGEGEQLIDNYMCALKKKILLQGRLYVFDHHVCFSCNLFGYHKIKVIPMESIVGVYKRRNVGFPNSIKIMWRNEEGEEKKEFFTSFLKREDAFRLIELLWHQSVSSPVSAGNEEEDSWSSHDHHDELEAEESFISHEDHHSDDKETERSTPEIQKQILEEQLQCQDIAPAIPDSMQRVLEYTLPVSPVDFFHAFLSTDSDFFEVFHRAQGHKSIKMTPWERHVEVGPVRDLTFITSLKNPIGPSEAWCHQTQRFHIYGGSGTHVLFETSQVMNDIPYGDHFKVQTRWDIKDHESDPDSSSLTIHIAVPFTKNTLWKRFIERGVTESLLEAYQMFRKLADKKLASIDLSSPNSVQTAESESPKRSPIAASRRPTSPDDLLPRSQEEWEMILNQIEPKFRGGLRSLRRMQEAVAMQNKIALSTPHHRRSSSTLSLSILNAIHAEDLVDGKAQEKESSEKHSIISNPTTSSSTEITVQWKHVPLRAVLLLILCVFSIVLLSACQNTSSNSTSSAHYMARLHHLSPTEMKQHFEILKKLQEEIQEANKHLQLWKQRIYAMEERHQELSSSVAKAMDVYQH